jgi:hypothetical protein
MNGFSRRAPTFELRCFGQQVAWLILGPLSFHVDDDREGQVYAGVSLQVGLTFVSVEFRVNGWAGRLPDRPS